MYIAFKWLVCLAVTMWSAMCVVDLIIKDSRKINSADVRSGQFEFMFKNKTTKTEPILSDTTFQGQIHHYGKVGTGENLAGLHFIMFIAGALAVTAFHKKQEIVTFAHRRAILINVIFLNKLQPHLKKTAIKLCAALSKCFLYLWEKINIFLNLVINNIRFYKICSVKQNKIHVILLNKLKQMGEERKNLGQLLISAIHENKNLRMRYQLETMTKNRLVQHIEDTQKQIKENRLKYVRFQQLYLVTHQENNYLKVRLGKLKEEKDEAEINLIGLINEIYKSENNKLKAYCIRFIVKTKDKILNSDVSADIQEFLEKSCKSQGTPVMDFSEHSNDEEMSTKSWPMSSDTRITEILKEDDSLVPLVSDAPRLKGLPGEYVWTVKDKDGIIEKLYEYDYASDLDNSDTIRRIRQYSVYYDKDCLLDFSKIKREANNGTPRFLSRSFMLGTQRIVTGTTVFQQFLQSTISNAPPKPDVLPMLCD